MKKMIVPIISIGLLGLSAGVLAQTTAQTQTVNLNNKACLSPNGQCTNNNEATVIDYSKPGNVFYTSIAYGSSGKGAVFEAGICQTINKNAVELQIKGQLAKSTNCNLTPGATYDIYTMVVPYNNKIYYVPTLRPASANATAPVMVIQ